MDPICDYQPIKIIGKGMFGTVMKVEKDGEVYALKVERFPLPGINSSALREAVILSQFVHPYILHADDIFFDCDHTLNKELPSLHSITPLAEINLDNWLRIQKPIPDRIKAFHQIVQALSALHKQGFIHGDLKPANVLMINGDAVVSDFGTTVRDIKQIKQTPVGSPLWIAPEIFLDEQYYTGAVDIWSLGVVLWDIFVGMPKFSPKHGDNSIPVLHTIVEKVGVSGGWPKSPKHRSKIQEVMNGHKIPEYQWMKFPPGIREEYTDEDVSSLEFILNSCLQLDPAMRITADQILQLPLFDDLPLVDWSWLGSQSEAVVSKLKTQRYLHKLAPMLNHSMETVNLANQIFSNYINSGFGEDTVLDLHASYYLASLLEEVYYEPDLLLKGFLFSDLVATAVKICNVLSFRLYP